MLHNNIGLYIHIPFCKKKCDYCDFVSSPIGNDMIPNEYIDALGMEIQSRMDVSNCKAMPWHGSTIYLPTIFIGGGTPSLMTAVQIMKLGSHCKNAPEWSIEINPGTITSEKLHAMKQIGINRISIGIQSFNDEELQLLGRIHDRKTAIDAIEMVRNAGFKNFNVDLIFGLPGQSLNNWKQTLEIAIEQSPTHISAYNLQIEENTPFYERQYSLDNDKEYAMYTYTIDALKSQGYIHYEISNFAKPGFECKHNINYWKNGDYLGIGVSAASHLNGKRYVNSNNIDEYIKAPVNNRIEEDRSDKDEITETIFMGLRLMKGLNLKDFETRFNKPITAIYEKELRELTNEDLVTIADNHLYLTNKGIFLANIVFEKFI